VDSPYNITADGSGLDAIPGKPSWLVDINQGLKDLKRMVKP
jgi:hypothetical protein